LDNKHILIVGKLFNWAPILKHFFFTNIPYVMKLIVPLEPIPIITLIIIDLHMAIIQVHLGKNLVDDVLLNERV
jgi:hypothetical protein